MIAALEADPQADAAIAAAPVTDTIKRAGRDGGRVSARRSTAASCGRCRRRRCSAAPRSSGALDVDAEALARATDDAWLIERAGRHA